MKFCPLYPDIFIADDGTPLFFGMFKVAVEHKPNGRLHVRFRDKSGNLRSFALARMVASAYLDGFNDLMNVEHIDGNVKNNHPSNLRLKRSKMLSDRQKQQILDLHATGDMPVRIARMMGLDVKTVKHLLWSQEPSPGPGHALAVRLRGQDVDDLLR